MACLQCKRGTAVGHTNTQGQPSMVKPKGPKVSSTPELEPPMLATNPDQLVLIGSMEQTIQALNRKLNSLLQAIEDVKMTLKPKLDTFTIDMGLLRADHSKPVEHIESELHTVHHAHIN
ncbi:hypothetical protein NDU88_002961 [Pleurodeles waltl]|uniref:Uncharacterized protein n=1 Tax=Pleurodeles waltl TaxID=8319 RepID=A0AAV7UBD4_PLEWA|nr:hypothetical protein NDU88_002961 [Pleurodeles waltl]